MKRAAAPAMAAVPGASPVPGFLAKLWALVEDSGSDDVICWSRNGQNFCILDEQRFAKELLPKYFKHNNLSSFIRQLNIYGFRKVIALENGMMTAEKNSAIEFQHPFFKRGKANLLANIKRKVSAVRPEDLKVCPEDLQKVLSEVQEMREQQSNMDLKLASMKRCCVLCVVFPVRENQALWKEVAFLRQKHSQQQQLLSKVPAVDSALSQELPRREGIPACKGQSPSELQLPVGPCSVQLAESPLKADAVESGAVELRSAQASAPEDTAAVIDSILNENQAVAQSDPLLDREEIQDFLNCIDASLEELQAMLSGKKFNGLSETPTDVINLEFPSDVNLAAVPPGLENMQDLPESAAMVGMNEQETAGKNGMQLIQYRGNPLLSLFEEPPSSDAACKMEEDKDGLLPLLEDRPSAPPPPPEPPLQLLDPAGQADGTPAPEPLEQPLLSEDMSGEYKLFPLLLLSPVANFIDEASEIETS
ncbi:hypothetical protein lerEdw1_010325 [Lerista edwardsae]|nr:hypothetical protein lerEdw1_010325 [Lerista edwardsae]